MAFFEQAKRDPAADAFSLAMLLLLILSLGWLLYGENMDSVYAGIGALLAIPFVLSALIVRGSGMQYSLWGACWRQSFCSRSCFSRFTSGQPKGWSAS
jgi:hypothetical protein